MVKRVGDDDVQAALETVNGSRYGTPVDGIIVGGSEGGDAA